MDAEHPTVLVVDDDLDTLQNLSDILTDMGYQVETASSGPAALEMVRGKPYDVALLDLKMPGMDGLTLYREIRKLRAGTVAMVVTAYATTETVAEAKQAGLWHVLSKPVDFSQLLPLVEEAVQQPLVMVVDDDRELCENLWDILRERGFRVAVAHDDREAAGQLHGGRFQVVLIDMKLPGGDGRQVLKMVQQANPEARTVLITGFRSEMEELVRSAVKEGADAVCYKPFDVPGLIETIARLSERDEKA